MYKVIEYFRDVQDGHYEYHAGDMFPRKGVTASKERLEELSSNNNLRGFPLIKYVPDPGKKEKEKGTFRKRGLHEDFT